MKKVAIISPGTFPIPPVDGGAVENLIQSLIDENEKAHKVYFTVFSIYSSRAEEKAKNYNYTNVEFVKIPKVVKFINFIVYWFCVSILKRSKQMSYRYILQRLYYIFVVSNYLRKNNYDKVVLENHATLYLCLKFWKNYKRYKGRYVYHMHNTLSGYYFCKQIIEQTPIVLGVSNYIIKEYKKEVVNYSKSTKFVVLKNKVDNERFIQPNLDLELKYRHKFNISSKSKVVLFTGRMNKEKGIDKLLEAWKEVNLPNSVLLIVGDYYFNSKVKNSVFSNYLESLIKENKNIIFTGYIDYNDISAIYGIADVVVLPSTWEDPAPLTVIEALSSGKALITTNSGGIPEYANNKGAIILNKEDKDFVRKLSRAILSLLKDKEKIIKMSNYNYKKTSKWNLMSFYNDFIDDIK